MDKVKFHLITDGASRTVTPRFGNRANPKFRLKAGIHPGNLAGWNRELCQEVKARLTEILPRNQWDLTIEFKLDQVPSLYVENAFGVDVEGEMLRKLHSVICYGVDSGRMKMSLFAKAKCTGPSDYERGITIRDKVLMAEMDLGSYSGHNYGFALSNGPLQLENISKWELTDVQLCIEGTYGFLRNTGLEVYSSIMEIKRETFEIGVGADVKIIGKDDAIILCHEEILVEKCPALAAMITESTVAKRRVRELQMLDWSKDEIQAFFSFLYCRGTEKAKADQSIAMSVLEMGQKYAVELNELQQIMKEILLKTRSSHFYLSEDLAVRIRTFGEKNNDIQLERKGQDVLKWLGAMTSDGI